MAAVLPQAFRQAMKQSLDNARRGFEAFMGTNEEAPSTDATLLSQQSGTAVLLNEMTRMARSNVEANFRAALRLVDAENADQLRRLYIEYMRERMTALSRQVQEIGSLTAQAVRAADGRGTGGQTPASAVPSSIEGSTAATKGHHTQVTRTPKRHGEPEATRATRATKSAPKTRIVPARNTEPRVTEKKKSGKTSSKGEKKNGV